MRDRLYGRFPALMMARRNLTRARIRALLAILCIVIGVAAIGSLGLLGSAFKRDQVERFDEIGNDLNVRPGEDAGGEFTDRQVQQIELTASDADVVPIKRTTMQAQSGGETTGVQVYGVEDASSLYDARRGRIPQTWRKQALVGASIANQLGIDPGSSIRLDGTTYRVAAVVEGTSFGGVPNPRSAIVLPSERIETRTYAQIVVRTDSREAANETAERIRDRMNGREERVSVNEPGKIGDRIDEFFATLNLFLMGIGAISLLVAGISILNVMLMSVIERREEIGVLRAVGYQKLDIVRVMLVEAATLGVVGSGVGIGLALLAGLIIQDLLLGRPFDYDRLGMSYVLGAFTVGVVVSVLAGLYPAWKAANERPVEALRN